MGPTELGYWFWEHGCCYVLRAPATGPISLDRYASGGRARADKVESAVRTGIREQPRALADDHRIDDEVELVDQLLGQQPSEEDAAARHQQAAALLRLQITHRAGDIALEESRARPLRVGQGGRCHVLGPAVQCGADRAGGHFG